jgi:tripartite-type tricarboxylate transporter receptor subunit TctC
MMSAKRFLGIAIAGLGLLCGAGAAFAQSAAANYPNGPIKVIVSAAAGGGNDLIARIAGDKLQRKWGQNVVVDNRPGAGNNLATEIMYRSPPDGYTIMVSPPASLVVNQVLFKELRFDPAKIEPVAITSYIPNVMVVNANSPFKTAQDLIDFAKKNPGKLSYASQGRGTTGHLTGALFEALTGSKQNHVPFGGAAPALNSVAGGQVDFMFADIGTTMPLLQGGLVRVLATLTKDRITVAPDVPTIAEVGMPDLLSDTWTAFTAPPGTPLDVREKMGAALKEMIFEPETVAKLAKIGVIPLGLGPKESADLIARETKRWTDVVKNAGIGAE